MRTFVHAAFLAGLFLPSVAYAADLDYPYEPPAPPPVAVVPPPPPVVAVLPRCGFYRPCVRPWRFGYGRRPWVYGYAGPRPYVVGPRPYAVAPPPAGYGDRYGYDRERFDRYGYAAPRPGYEGPRGGGPQGYGPREHEQREGYRDGRPYADPLGHDRARRDERFDRYGDEHRGGERFDRERGRPDFRDEPG